MVEESAGEREDTGIPELVDHQFRRQAGQVIATLARIFGPQHLDLVEDVLQETLIKALHQWAYRGIPEEPTAWILQVAKNHAFDLLRREQSLRDKREELIHLHDQTGVAEVTADVLDHQVWDDQLRMLFTCCHPALSRSVQIALTLNTVCGLGVPEIARAFLTAESTIAQRLVRARRTLRDQTITFATLEAEDVEARLDTVLEVLYLLFNEGYSAHQGEDLIRHELCAEAIWLTSLVAHHPAGDITKVHALLALMLLQASRLSARTDVQDNLVPLEEQDRTLWDQHMIAAGLCELIRSARGESLTLYHVQAGIAACHAVAANDEVTDWPCILAYYDDLITLAPSPVVALNRAVALARVQGITVGLAAVESIQSMPGMSSYHLLYATAADLWRRLGDLEEAAAYYRRALELAPIEPERRFLQRRLDVCEEEINSTPE
jgi:RNA polymerase sigma factor (sigma-70 family)